MTYFLIKRTSSLTIMLYSTLISVVLLCGLGSSFGEKTPSNCEKKEKSLAILDTISDSIKKAKRFYPNCTDGNSIVNATDCSEKEKSSAYLDIAEKLVADARKIVPTCPDIKSRKHHERPMDCNEVLQNGQNVSGVYTIWPRNRIHTNRSLNVFCDMDTDGGGWMMLQRRGNFSPELNFYEDWNAYKNGFGNISRDFWLGNDNIYALSNQETYKIRFDMEDFEGKKAYAIYETFWIEDEKSNYTLHIQNYSGNGGDSMEFSNGMMFSTKDRAANDNYRGKCVNLYHSGWWFKDCTATNPNGLYRPGNKEDKTNIFWYDWKNRSALAAMEIKLTRT